MVNAPDEQNRNRRTNGQKNIEVYNASIFIADEC